MVERSKSNAVSEVSATLRNLAITPRKVMLVTQAINHKPLADALVYLNHTPKRAGKSVLKLLNSAIANAVNNHALNYNDLEISTIFVTEGRRLKRFRPRAKGVTYPILKRYSHIKVILTTKKSQDESPKKSTKRRQKPDQAMKLKTTKQQKERQQ